MAVEDKPQQFFFVELPPVDANPEPIQFEPYTLDSLRQSIAWGMEALRQDRSRGYSGSSRFEAMLLAAAERLHQLETQPNEPLPAPDPIKFPSLPESFIQACVLSGCACPFCVRLRGAQ